jgi:hypothetical protein
LTDPSVVLGDKMIQPQIERLRKDVHVLDHYIAKLRKQGRIDLMRKIMLKRDYLSSTIEEIEEELLAA